MRLVDEHLEVPAEQASTSCDPALLVGREPFNLPLRKVQIWKRERHPPEETPRRLRPRPPTGSRAGYGRTRARRRGRASRLCSQSPPSCVARPRSTRLCCGVSGSPSRLPDRSDRPARRGYARAEPRRASREHPVHPLNDDRQTDGQVLFALVEMDYKVLRSRVIESAGTGHTVNLRRPRPGATKQDQSPYGARGPGAAQKLNGPEARGTPMHVSQEGKVNSGPPPSWTGGGVMTQCPSSVRPAAQAPRVACTDSDRYSAAA